VSVYEPLRSPLVIPEHMRDIFSRRANVSRASREQI
jgi:hypothetical protein